MGHQPLIGVLALQGCVERHRPHIEAAGAEFAAVKTPEQFDEADAFILPGGESTTMLKLIDTFGLWDSLERNFKTKPVWGICAGAILLAEKVLIQKNKHPDESQDPEAKKLDPGSSPGCLNKESEQKSFGLMPMTVERNGYGRQLDSHYTEIDGYKVSFIRAPVIKEVAATVNVKASHDGDPVWLDSGQIMITTFHPELTFDFPSPMHRNFIALVRNSEQQKAA